MQKGPKEKTVISERKVGSPASLKTSCDWSKVGGSFRNVQKRRSTQEGSDKKGEPRQGRD